MRNDRLTLAHLKLPSSLTPVWLSKEAFVYRYVVLKYRVEIYDLMSGVSCVNAGSMASLRGTVSRMSGLYFIVPLSTVRAEALCWSRQWHKHTSASLGGFATLLIDRTSCDFLFMKTHHFEDRRLWFRWNVPPLYTYTYMWTPPVVL